MQYWMSILALVCGITAHAGQVWPIDDRGSQILDSLVEMQWDSWAPPVGQADTLSGQTVLRVHLNVRQWQGKNVRIFHHCQPHRQHPVTITWRSRGLLMSGQLTDGERRLVYQGILHTPTLEDVFQLDIQTDGNRWTRVDQLDCGFELELDSP